MGYWQWTHGMLICFEWVKQPKQPRMCRYNSENMICWHISFYIWIINKKIIFISFKIRDELTKNTGSHGTTNKDFSRITCKEPRFPVICIRLSLWMKRKIFLEQIFVLLPGMCPEILTELPRFVLYRPIMGWCQVKLCVDFNIFSFFAKSN